PDAGNDDNNDTDYHGSNPNPGPDDHVTSSDVDAHYHGAPHDDGGGHTDPDYDCPTLDTRPRRPRAPWGSRCSPGPTRGYDGRCSKAPALPWRRAPSAPPPGTIPAEPGRSFGHSRPQRRSYRLPIPGPRPWRWRDPGRCARPTSPPNLRDWPT